MAIQLQRQVFEIFRAAEYFTVRELQAQTGQLAENFAKVPAGRRRTCKDPIN